jgi:hypothetical protein
MVVAKGTTMTKIAGITVHAIAGILVRSVRIVCTSVRVHGNVIRVGGVVAVDAKTCGCVCFHVQAHDTAVSHGGAIQAKVVKKVVGAVRIATGDGTITVATATSAMVS